jgi:hypothetical protein
MPTLGPTWNHSLLFRTSVPGFSHTMTCHLCGTSRRRATETCRLTPKRLARENAHIIPSAEKIWFADNAMDRYRELGGRTGQDVADSPANLIRLRRNVHLLWDSLFFSIVPKESPNGETAETRWCAHGMVQDEELYADYHNRPTKSLAGRSVEYLYARFAWDIFPKVIGFLQSTQPRRLAIRFQSPEIYRVPLGNASGLNPSWSSDIAITNYGVAHGWRIHTAKSLHI